MNISDVMQELGIDGKVAVELVRTAIPGYKLIGYVNSKLTDEEYNIVINGYKKAPTAPLKKLKKLEEFNNIQGEVVDIIVYKALAEQSKIGIVQLKEKIEELKKTPEKVRKTIITNESWLRDPRFVSILFGGYKYIMVPLGLSRKNPLMDLFRGMFCEVIHSDITNDYFVLVDDDKLLYVYLIL
jgi:hypothetical protein